MSEYYKALIPDELVIQELLKESQRRLNQPVDSTRLKPNLNFFQRTVNSLVSTNNRIDKSLDAVKAKTSHHKSKKIKSSYVPSVPSSLTDFTFERHINFVSASSKTTRTSRRDKESSIKSGTSKKCKKDKLKKLAKYIDEVSTDSGSDESSTHKKSDHQNQDKVSTDSDDDSHEYPHKKTYQNRDNSSKNHLIHSKSNDVILISSSDDEHSDGNAKKSSHRKKRRKD